MKDFADWSNTERGKNPGIVIYSKIGISQKMTDEKTNKFFFCLDRHNWNLNHSLYCCNMYVRLSYLQSHVAKCKRIPNSEI